ncbi:polysaccharide deacetylase family protein [bacterium]|nr:polysaccharide deacetylase family protein [bacterium]
MLYQARSWRGILILNYHRIGNGSRSSCDRNLWSATAESFEEQVRYVTKHYDVIGLEDLDLALRNPRGRFVVITFDDGYLDNYTEAFPILKSYHAKGAFFITTGFLDVPSIPWWDEIAWMVRRCPLEVLPANRWSQESIRLDYDDRESVIQMLLLAYKKSSVEQAAGFLSELADVLQTGRAPQRIAHELWMTWPMLREMQQAGMTIGGHTVTHPILATLTAEQQDYEVGECLRRIRKELGTLIDTFSYPVGGQSSFNIHTRKALEKHGVRWAFTFIGGHIRPRQYDRFALPRTAIETDINAPLFNALLTLPQWYA